MKTKTEQIINLPLKSVLAQYTAKEFYQNRLELEGIEGSSITRFEQKAEKTLIEIQRHTEIKTDKLPGMLKKAIDKLVGSSANIVTTAKWNKDTASGINTIQAQGVPIRSTITFKLSEKSPKQCLVKAELEVQAKIPIIGGQLEKFMLPKAQKALQKDLQKTAHYMQAL